MPAGVWKGDESWRLVNETKGNFKGDGQWDKREFQGRTIKANLAKLAEVNEKWD